MTLKVIGSVLACGLWSWSASSSAADIYRAELPDGTVLFASEPQGPGYALYLKDPSGKHETSLPQNQIRKTSSSARAACKSLPSIRKLASKHGVDAALVTAMVEVESNCASGARSVKGAVGLMQLMPATAAQYGVRNRLDSEQNLDAGIRLLKDLLALHDGNIALALASYNAGQRTIARYGNRIPPYRETMLYVPAVLSRMHSSRNTHQE